MGACRFWRTVVAVAMSGVLGSLAAPGAGAVDCGLYPWAPGCPTATTTQPAPAPAAATQASAAAVATAVQSGGFAFVLGFKTLHDLDPADIGDPTENQAFAPNGDAQQHTTRGLMAWRKADNWTAFTNGYMTWINGPSGLVSRLNTTRCSFEGDAANFPASDCGGAQPASSGQVTAPPSQPAAAPAGGGCLSGIAGAYEKYTSHAQHGVAPRNGDVELMTLGPDCTWRLNGGASGSWSTSPIDAGDVKTWGGKPSGSDTKIVFSGWPGAVGGSASGPIEMSGGSPNFTWAVYDSGSNLGQMQIRYEFNSNPCGPSNSVCSGMGGGSNLAQTMMRIEAAQGAANISL